MWDANVGTTDPAPRGRGGGRACRGSSTSRRSTCSATRMAGIVDETYRRDLAGASVSCYDETKYRAHEAAEARIDAGAPIVIAHAQPGRTAPATTPSSASSWSRRIAGSLPYVAARRHGRSRRPTSTTSPPGIIAALDRGEARRARTSSRATAPAFGEALAIAAEAGGRARCRRLRVPDGLLRVDGAVRAASSGSANAARGRRRLGGRDLLGVVAAGEGRAGLRAAGRRHGHPRHARERLTYTRPMARELPMFDPTPGHHAPSPSEISIAMGGGPFGPAADGTIPLRRHPDWIKARMPSGDNYHDLKGLLRGLNLNTVCEEARCPNIGDCWDQRTATVMILGDVCTRACGFCAIKTGKPTWFDDDEPRRVAEAVARDAPRARRGHLRRPRRPARRRRRRVRGHDPRAPPSKPRHGRRGPDPRLQRRRAAAAHGDGGRARHPQPQPRDRPAPAEAGPQACPLGPDARRARAGQGLRERVRARGPHQELADGRPGRDPRGARPRRSRRCARSTSTSSRSASTCGRRSSTCR